MKITISVGGTWYAFQMAAQLDRRGALDRLIATHRPQRGEAIAPQRIVANLLPELFVQLPRRLRIPWEGEYYKAQAFDWWASGKVDRRTNLLVAFTSFGLHTIRAAKAHGVITVAESGGTHMSNLRALVEDEHRRWVLPPPRIDERLYVKQLWEYREADYVGVLSTFSRESFIREGIPPERIICVPPGVDTGLFRPRPKGDGVFRILAGGLRVRKGIAYLLDAVAGLPRARVELATTGRIPPDALPILSKYDVPVRHYGPLPRGRLAELFAQSSVLVLPSIEDGFGLVILEALASGIPVIASVHTGGPDVIRESEEGFIVPIRDSATLRDRLLFLYEHESERRRMGEAARHRAEEFSEDRYGDRLTEAYERVLARHLGAVDGTGVRQFYGDIWRLSEIWDACGHWTDAEFARHFDALIRPGDVVLDVGCGDAGAYQSRIMKLAGTLYGVDVSAEAVERARLRGVRATVHDLGQPLPFDDSMFDKVLCLEVLEHLFDPKFAVQEITRVLKPGGLLILSVPNAGYFRDRLLVFFRGQVDGGVADFANPWKAPHIRFFNVGRLVAMLEASGMQVSSVKSKADPSIFDGLEVLGGPGRFLARQLRERVPRSLRLAFLGDVWPSLFAPGLLVLAQRPADPAVPKRLRAAIRPEDSRV